MHPPQQHEDFDDAQQSWEAVGAGAEVSAFTSFVMSPRQQPPPGFVTSQWQVPAFTSALMTSSTVLFPVRVHSSRMLSALWPKQ